MFMPSPFSCPVAVLPDSSAPDKGTRVKVAGIVVHEEGGHTDPSAYPEHLSLQGEKYQSLGQQTPGQAGGVRPNDPLLSKRK
jgi:hypothetical protein